jgi:hypothetical protein
LIVAPVFAMPALAQAQGTVFTTAPNGQYVEGNIYPRKRDVLLSGGAGPFAPCGASVLADGDYYFQVTDPSGTQLLSMDSVLERSVRVTNGVVSQYLGSTHPSRNNGPCGATIVRLMPYLDTPSPSADYKVWMTLIGDYDPKGSGAFGFSTAHSVTDDFKIGAPGIGTPVSIIKGFVFYDRNENGVWDPLADPLEVPVPGWRIELLLEGRIDGVTYTDMNGKYVFIRDRDSTTYVVREQAPGGFVGDNIVGAEWVAQTPREAEVIADEELPPSPNFGVVSLEVREGVGRTKGFWHNQNGGALLEQCEPQWRDVLTTRNGSPVSLRRDVSSDVPSISVFAPLPLPASFTSAFDDWSDYEVGQGASGHAGYMLSTQVAAAMLNSSCGFMQFNAYIDRHNDGILVSFQSMLDGVIHLLNEPGAGLTGPNDPFQDLRAMMLMCINEFGSINNTGDPSSPQIVRGRSSAPNSFVTPY